MRILYAWEFGQLGLKLSFRSLTCFTVCLSVSGRDHNPANLTGIGDACAQQASEVCWLMSARVAQVHVLKADGTRCRYSSKAANASTHEAHAPGKVGTILGNISTSEISWRFFFGLLQSTVSRVWRHTEVNLLPWPQHLPVRLD